MLTTTARASFLLSPLKNSPSNSFKTFQNSSGSVVTGRKSLHVKYLQFHSNFFTKRLSNSHTFINQLKKSSRPIIPIPGISYTRLEVPVSLLPFLRTTTRGVQTENNSLSEKNTEKKIVIEKKVDMDSAVEAIKVFVPSLSQGKHKGQAGKIAVVGGCREYTGAPYFAAFSALKMGADLSHVFCSKDAATVIKSYSPELIVHPVLRESWEALVEGEDKEQLVNQVVAEVGKWLPRFDCLVFGPGLGRDPLLMECVTQVMKDARKNNIPMVIDGDALSIVTDNPELVHGYRLAVLTPNLNEHKRLSAKIVNHDTSKKPDDEDLPGQLKSLAKSLGNVTIVQKGPVDLISDGNEVLEMGLFGSPRRCGGQGDVLAGSTAVFLAWANTFDKSQPENSEEKKKIRDNLSPNPAMAAAYAASLLVRRSATPAFEKYRRSMITSELIEELGNSMEELYPVAHYEYQGPKL